MALKLTVKDFDYKQFFLRRGEWVALGAVLLIVIPLVAGGIVKVWTAGSPASRARDMQNLVKEAENKIAMARVPVGADQPPKEFFEAIKLEKVSPEPYRTSFAFNYPSEIEDTKRRKPEILAPSEFQMQTLFAPVRGAIINKGANDQLQVEVLHQKDADPRQKLIASRFRGMAQIPGGIGNFGAGFSGGGGSGRGGGRGMGFPGGGFRSGSGRFNPRRSTSSTQIEYLDLDKVRDNSHLAEDVYPVRMIIVSASFPLKEQLNEFRRALHRHSLSELSAMIASGDAIWTFVPPEIQRRVFDRNGKEISGWEPYNQQIAEAVKFYLARAAERAAEDPMMLRNEGIINVGLVMARPPLARGEYPPVVMPNLRRGIANADRFRSDPSRRPISFKSKKLQQRGIDPFNSLNPIGTGEDKQEKNNEPAAEKKGEEPKPGEGDELSVPEFALLRFIDAAVEPGYVYQYRVKVRMRNPNFGKHNLAYPALGREQDIAAPEFTMTPRCAVPKETEWYVMDEKPRNDRLAVQIHHWVDFTQTNPDENTQEPIGDWAILERLFARRGEYIGHWANTELPEWKVEKDIYELAVNTKTNSPKIPVDFSTKSKPQDDDGVLLLDYSGGKATPIQTGSTKSTEDVPVEALVLTPEGKLLVRRQQEDSKNTKREARVKAWKDWMLLVKTGRTGKNNNRWDLFNRQMIPGQEAFRRGRGGS
jgi:hypothetical protein